MLNWIKGLFGTGDSVKKTLEGVGNLAKDVKTLVTGKLDPEKEIELLSKLSRIETSMAKIQSNVVSTKANGNWLQRSWRPVTMMTFLLLTVLNQFNLLIIPLSEEVWELFKYGLAGYIGGRSVEKVVKIIKR